ncbi:unnamed protein product, partial [Didymodactylos carnosus]
DRLKCHSNGHCVINLEKRKRCKRCRLQKCFKLGMRKEWILTNEEKQRKKRKIEENRRLRQLSDNYQLNIREVMQSSDEQSSDPNSLSQSSVSAILTSSDWNKLNEIQTAYCNAVSLNSVVGKIHYPFMQKIATTDLLINVPTNIASLRLIAYCKQIREFHDLNEDDKVTLIKYNMLGAIFVHGVLIYDPLNDTFHEENTDDGVFDAKDFISNMNLEFYQRTITVMKDVIQIVEYDRIIVKILIILVICSKGFCAYESMREPILNDPLSAYKTQNIFTDLLWRYCLNQYGYIKTINLFTKLSRRVLNFQILAIDMRHFVNDASIDQKLVPLMKSVMLFT